MRNENQIYKVSENYGSGVMRTYQSALSESWAIDGHIYTAMENTTIELYEDGLVKSFILAENTKVLTSHGKTLKLKEGTRVFFGKDESLLFYSCSISLKSSNNLFSALKSTLGSLLTAL